MMNTVHDMSSEASVDGDIPRPVFSRFYARLCPRLEDEGLAELRAELLAGLTGDVVEIGAGNGQNFRHYPAGVRSVVAVEPEPHLRGLAVRAARAATLPVSVRAGRAESLPLPEASVDAAVLCLVMCSLPDRVAALAELRRVLRPGGVVRFLEHTRADTAGLALVQRIADATLWPWFTGGCHTARDPLAALRDAGFTVTRVRRLRFPAGRAAVQPSSPHVLGAAQAERRR
jgi:SAM-dependent methyltransferase